MKGNSKEAIANKIKDIIVDLLVVRHDQITLNSRFREDLEADSLDLVELIMAGEDEFGLEVRDEDAQKIMRVSDAVDYVIKHINR